MDAVVTASTAAVGAALADTAARGRRFDVCYATQSVADVVEALRAHNPALASTPVVLVVRDAASTSATLEVHEPVRRHRLIHVTARALGVQGVLQEGLSRVVAATPAAPLPATAVLLVDDNAVNREVALAMLERLGCAVEIACDGSEGCDALERSDFDLVFMDCQMPVMDGFDATREIRRRERAQRRKRIPIVALTANALSGDREVCLAAGMDDFVSKPFHLRDLGVVLDRFRAQGSPKQAAEANEVPGHAPGELDPAAIAAIRSVQRPGRPDILLAVVSLYVKSAPADLAALRTALTEGRAQDAERAAHKLKGGSRTLGARTLADQLAEIEATVTSVDPRTLVPRVEAINAALDAAITAMKSLVPIPKEVVSRA